jgi:pSer/pThr/pTyr-binding forkhead associated (FHA) protein
MREQFAGAYLHLHAEGEVESQRFFIPKGARMIVGRRGDLQIPDNERRISSHHARIEIVGDDAFIENLGSTNGTFVNGRQVDSKAQLHDGDIISFGGVKTVFRKLN